ncbi:Serine/threonine protein kinase [Prosthecobacter debontii]|uniref:Serine/threonine protein kinase n=1 Tax=Prosthecobacter debontii TaxID=48467 RepID=A0A1T4WL80_9BACT|nr:bifunctional serine/threonine-protein kinase/formylglycine-generating enzyme family protein [Prosthecobacter debontii]SKA78093.1 Serine/threonine protein kinase [Prosthecobacter debontii]
MSDTNASLIACPRCGKSYARKMLVGGVCPACVAKNMQRQLFANLEAEIEEKEPLSLNVQGYEIQELIGGGGMGEVYRAVLTARGRVVAMKVVSGRLTRDPEVTGRFEAEVAALSQLSHHNVVRVLDHGETVNGRHFLVMEYVDGCDLRRLLRAQRLELERALDIFLKVCAGVSHAHQRGFVHRDIKPANILIGADGTVKVADFGLAKTLVESASSYGFTQTRDTFGTPYYVAPEVTRSAGQADARADVYALGVLLYELLTGSVPMGQFTPLSQKTGLSKKIDGIINHALADDPQRRLSSVEEMATAVEKIAAEHQRGHVKRVRSRKLMTLAAIFATLGLGAAVGSWISERHVPAYLLSRSGGDAVKASRERPWRNSLGMSFVPVPVPKQRLLFSQFETRVKEYEAFTALNQALLPSLQEEIYSERREVTKNTPAVSSEKELTNWRKPGFSQTPDHPVCGMRLAQARLFCAWLTRHEHDLGWLKEGQVYRLPTDAEWSFAAGITDDAGPYASDRLSTEPNLLPTGNFAGQEVKRLALWPLRRPADAAEDSYPCTAPVGSFPANAYGLFDLHGNVLEWTMTRLDGRFGFPPDYFCLRGGSWATGRLNEMRPEFRKGTRSTRAQADFGFRIVLDLESKVESLRSLDPLE